MRQSISLSSSSSWYLRVVLILFPAISLAKVCRPSYKSAAATHSTPGSVTAVRSNPEPCMPTPMMPKRILSLAAASQLYGMRESLSMIRGIAIATPVVAALLCRNCRRDIRFLFMILSLIAEDELRTLPMLLQWLQVNFLEKYNVVVAVVLQANPSFVRTRAALRFEIELLVRDRLSFGVVRNLHAV